MKDNRRCWIRLCSALGSLLLIRFPAPPASAEGQQARGSYLQEIRFGARYILQRRGLVQILAVFFFINLFSTLTYFGVHTPLILTRTGGNEVGLGVVRTVMGLGGILGGLLISIWGVPRRKTRVFLITTALSFLVCDFLTAASRSVPAWAQAGVWFCGPAGFGNTLREALGARGLAPERFHQELFEMR